jgi:hypothetical protein
VQRQLSSLRRATLLLGACAALFLPRAASAQNITTSIANEFRYGDGQRFEVDRNLHKEYLEDLFNTRFYTGDVTVGFRIQIDHPREYGRDTIGLKEYFAEFKRDGLRARAGTFYNLIGRGLVFNGFESRPIGFDAMTEGVKVDYDEDLFSAQAFGGRMNYQDILSATRTEEYLLRGTSGEIRPIKELGIGGSYLAATGEKTRFGFTSPFDAYLREIYLRGDYGGFRTFLNYADKRTQIDSSRRAITSSPMFGYALYGLLGYSNDLLGLNAEYKNYRYDLVDPSEQQTYTRETRALPFQNAPTLIPEYDKTLLARNPHAIDFSDELGYSLEAIVTPVEDLTITLVGAAGSRHNAFQAVHDTAEDGTSTIVYKRINDLPLSMPKIKDIRYSPYWELYAHSEYELNEDLSFAIGLQHRDNVIYHEGNGIDLPTDETYRANTLMLESFIGIVGHDVLHAILELQNVYDSKKVSPIAIDSLGVSTFDGHYDNALLTLEYSHSPRWSINTRIEYTTAKNEQIDLGDTGNGDKKERHVWPVVGATYRIGDAHTLGIQYGAERGGVVCTGGVCRLINPFTGFRISIVSKL